MLDKCHTGAAMSDRYGTSVSTPTGEETERLLLALLRVLWLLGGGACAFVLTVLVPPVALVAGLGLVAVALVRRRAGAYRMFTVGFAVWCAVYAGLAVFGALADGPSSGVATDHLWRRRGPLEYWIQARGPYGEAPS